MPVTSPALPLHTPRAPVPTPCSGFVRTVRCGDSLEMKPPWSRPKTRPARAPAWRTTTAKSWRIPISRLQLHTRSELVTHPSNGPDEILVPLFQLLSQVAH